MPMLIHTKTEGRASVTIKHFLQYYGTQNTRFMAGLGR
jgi:hypothetical protein